MARTDYPVPFVNISHRLDWHVDDGQNGSYRSWSVAGSGGGIPGNETSWRIDCPFTPALPTNVKKLHVWIDEARVKERDADPRTIKGPWDFIIPL